MSYNINNLQDDKTVALLTKQVEDGELWLAKESVLARRDKCKVDLLAKKLCLTIVTRRVCVAL